MAKGLWVAVRSDDLEVKASEEELGGNQVPCWRRSLTDEGGGRGLTALLEGVGPRGLTLLLLNEIFITECE